MKNHRYLLGRFKIGQIDEAIKLATEQFQILVKEGELTKGKDMSYVEIDIFLVTKEKIKE